MILNFSTPELEDAQRVRELTTTARVSDLSFGNLFLLRHHYETQIAFADGFLFRHYNAGRLVGFGCPCGTGDLNLALRKIEEEFPKEERPALLLVTDAQLGQIRAARPDAFTVITDPGDFDYLYRRDDLAEFSGAAFQAKRNHLNRFVSDHPDWRFAPLSVANVSEALGVVDAWFVGQGSPAELTHEREAIHEAPGMLTELGLVGGVVYVGDRPVAMSVASYISPEVADIHYEKCVPDCREAYPVICREMARRLTSRFINREEDVNVVGLRKSKLSYHPCELVVKHRLFWR